MPHVWSITSLITQKLQNIISNLDYIDNNYIELKIELNKDPRNIIYQTPYCLIHSQKSKINSLLLAKEISTKFNQINPNRDLLARISGQGWLEFIVSDRLISQYLNDLAKHSIIIAEKNIQIKKDRPLQFIDYYLHARCCSVLTSAHQQQIITINKLDFFINKWQIIRPENNFYQLFDTDNYAEKEIIKQIFLITEKINSHQIYLDKILTVLQELFFKLESQSPIWGETLKTNRELSQARLGLIALILHYYQNISYIQHQQILPIQI